MAEPPALVGAASADGRARPPTFALALAPPALLAALLLDPAVRGQPAVAATLVAASASLLLGVLALWRRQRRDGRALGLEFRPVRAHWVQASVQLCIYLYWGWYWHVVYESAALIAAQVVFVYALDMLLALARRRRWVVGFGPFPIIFSTNLFLLFKPEWFYWQFAMVALGVLGKEFIRWTRDGRSTHVFNPSAFALFVFSVALIATGATERTWAEEIATTLNRPPHIYVEIFLLGLVVQLMFSVTLVTLWAVIALVLLNLAYTQATGVYWFFDSNIPIAVFLGLHLLVTDPATSPRTGLGKALFGALYGAGVFALYGVLEATGAPKFYDKLLCVPLLNLLVPVLDRAGRSRALARLPGRAALSGPGNRVHVALWVVLFSTLLATGFVGRGHPGNDPAFWRSACEQERRNACRNLVKLHADHCGLGQGHACLAAGALLAEGEVVGRDPLRAGALLARGCDLGVRGACGRFERLVRADGRGALASGCEAGAAVGCYLMGEVLRYGIGGAPDPRGALDRWRRACDGGFARACGALGEALLFGDAGPPQPGRAARMLEQACAGDVAAACANLGLMYRRGHGVAADEARAAGYMRKACTAGVEMACE